MTDYISREEALAVFGDIHPLDHNANAYAKQIKHIPAADVRPVVLCRDCRNCLKADDWEYWCLGWGYPNRLVKPDDWCSCGADMRKEAETDEEY